MTEFIDNVLYFFSKRKDFFDVEADLRAKGFGEQCDKVLQGLVNEAKARDVHGSLLKSKNYKEAQDLVDYYLGGPDEIRYRSSWLKFKFQHPQQHAKYERLSKPAREASEAVRAVVNEVETLVNKLAVAARVKIKVPSAQYSVVVDALKSRGLLALAGLVVAVGVAASYFKSNNSQTA